MPAARARAEALDGQLHAMMAPLWGGLSPVSMALAASDWAWHLGTQPARAAHLAAQAWQLGQAAAMDALTQATLPASASERPDDQRFTADAWQRWPWNALARQHLAAEHWWRDATDLRGMQAHHRDVVGAFARQWLDMLSPTNAGLGNPEVLAATVERQGGNLVAGLAHAQDNWRVQHGLPRHFDHGRHFEPGRDVALTPGRVVHRNALVELIQYSPTTPRVQAEPVFIVPSWIMKYYILDLSPHDSMVRWLVDQGHTVFILSWRNPDAGDALLDMDDYLNLGVFDALAAVGRRVPGQAVHAMGYCLGGTLLAIAAAALARQGAAAGADALPRLASMSLLAAETDFSEPGEMGVLIDESQVALLEDMMAERGYLSGRQMAGSFQFLHSRELVWSATLREIWMGEPLRPNDLMAWNADTTRMPAAMHSQYLRRLYLHNELALSRYCVEGRPVSLRDLRLPVFLVGTEKDHVAPWRSVYKLHGLTDTELTFVLTSGGHNAGIVSEPGHAGRRWRQGTRRPGDTWRAPSDWAQTAESHDGSWWTAWDHWLKAHGTRKRVPARGLTAREGLGPAPGRYVHQRYDD
ncbi:PHA/PHB synthase family protein [Rubrivivax albus]|uniref:PHA/PHB synthase family protein n=1 Tax=Rubrivivax albus TaxID=2499835 RepID=UPI001E4F4935|nr:alpha/beta fold hydrolase [Rubrivivax albus]